ncbi:Retrotransposon-like protein 1 [Labeo rohita]|uniref:Retrotransposon-like protein 1 n=1 Tax=Labeo rohita TaxID=84645 RepID=A0ABQ8MU47_LABRO|nr:Retrotransposon-like protein 1 [Labeo rohita]
MSWAEDALWRLRQDGRELERYVEEFIELSHQVGWHETSLGAVFVLGLDDETIRCELPTCSFPLIELINLILYLNGSDFEVEEVQSPIRSHPPVSSQTQRNAPACPEPRTSTYRVNGSNRQPSPKSPVILQSSTAVLSPMRPASSPRSNPPATAQSPVPRPHASVCSQDGRHASACSQDGRHASACSQDGRHASVCSQDGRHASVCSQDGRHASVCSQDGRHASVCSQDGRHTRACSQDGRHARICT